MNRKAKGPGFTQRSGKSPAFKMMGSGSPVKYEGDLSVHDEEPEGVYTDPDNPGINRTWVNSRGVTMYRHPDGNSSSKPYDPTKTGVATHGDDRGYFDYMGQPATSGIERIQKRQRRGGTRVTPRGTADPLENLSTEDFWAQYSG